MATYSYVRTLLPIALLLGISACGPNDSGRGTQDDGMVVKDGRDLKDDPKVISPPILGKPIYECTSVVFVSGFIPNAEITVFADGMPVGTGQSYFTSNQPFTVSITFTKGQVITATQKFGG